jgi:hypothetical protein
MAQETMLLFAVGEQVSAGAAVHCSEMFIVQWTKSFFK